MLGATEGMEEEEAAVWASVEALSAGANAQARQVAVFDADGTLWRGDVGDLHLLWMEEQGLLTTVGAWGRYEALCAENVDAGYAFATTVMGGATVSDVVRAARSVWKQGQVQPLEPVVALARSLMSSGWEVWVVSASNRWMVEVAVHDMGVPQERVVGMECVVVDGRLGSELDGPITNGPGKVTAIQERIGVVPDLAVGNSVHDAEMLSYARQGVLVSGGPGPMAPTLRDMAGRASWLCWDVAGERPQGAVPVGNM